ncbi:conserved hypothetical protein [Neospora caninum Liverpool]|uniref:Uncharacterized protein n=1 Tax=Neospora caninum (strain Liverpool) TaxID=572307 RepID=F0VKD5_NEOCL|nr:conserved hypothetical protein [Neospora caninum Liverpool]CBZ54536.1 conserved hypothetical protein [Neospora caninum Liverpool]CEL69249.1 TPA: hypothetical protein BN1204_049650 [Neospora caninum Liverpool]|eukprot:XP_003884566.1 conserved hypothetical protein [Neospora caninum Liverpool]
MARLVRLSVATLLVFISVSVTSLRPFDRDSLAGEGGSTDTPLVIFGAAKIRGPLARAARRGVAKLGRNVTKSVRRIGRRTGLRLLHESRGHKRTHPQLVTPGEQPAVVPVAAEFLRKDRQQAKTRPALLDKKGAEAGTLRPSASVAAHDTLHAVTTKPAGSHDATKSEKRQSPRYVGQTTVVVEGERDSAKNGKILPLRRLQTTFTPVHQEASQGTLHAARPTFGASPSYTGHSDYSRSVASYSQQLHAPSSGPIFPFADPVGSVASIVNSMGMPTYPSSRSVYSETDDWVQRGMPSTFSPAFPPEGLASIANSVVQTLTAGPQALFRGQTHGAATNDIWGFADLGNVLARNTNNLLQTVGAGSLAGLGFPLW